MEREENKNRGTNILRTVYGIFMIIVFVGMGVLMFTPFFKETIAWDWLRWTAGCVLVVYGIWRAYRQFAGIDSRF